MQDKSEEVNLERALGFLRRRAPWILLCVVLAAGAAFAFSEQQTKEYTATASVVFNEDQLSQQIAGLQTAVGNNAEVNRRPTSSSFSLARQRRKPQACSVMG